MNNLREYIYLAEYIVPIISALSCAILLYLSRKNSYTVTEVRLKKYALLYLCASFFSWMSVFLYTYFPEAFIPIHSLTYLSLLYAQVLFSRLFHLLTASSEEEHFSRWHYIVPVIISGVLWIWSFFVPWDVQLEIVLGKGRVLAKGYEGYSVLFLSKLPVRFLYCIIYLTLTGIRLGTYYKRINTVSSLVRHTANWMFLLIMLALTSFIVSLVAGIMRGTGVLYTLFMAIASGAMFAQHIILTFILIQGRYKLYSSNIGIEISLPKTAAKAKVKDKLPSTGEEHIQRKPYTRGAVITRNDFERYFRKHKPFLDADCKMTDIAEKLDANRTYLSNFVNRTYGMNFSRYLNRCRLQELDRLKKLPSNEGKPLSELISKAGFYDMKHYRRALATEKADETDNVYKIENGE